MRDNINKKRLDNDRAFLGIMTVFQSTFYLQPSQTPHMSLPFHLI